MIHAGVLGLQMGLMYDLFRVFRRSFRCNLVMIAIMDLLYWGFVGYRTFFVMHTYSNGELRWFAGWNKKDCKTGEEVLDGEIKTVYY